MQEISKVVFLKKKHLLQGLLACMTIKDAEVGISFDLDLGCMQQGFDQIIPTPDFWPSVPSGFIS